jgi:hypothetical protein
MALAILLLLSLGCSCQKFAEMLNKSSDKPSSPGTNTATSSTTPKPEKNSQNDLTLAKYNQIRVGTSRSEVESILGGKGEEVSSSEGGGIRFTVIKWEGENFSSIILTFKNDKVLTRSQVGLK